MLFANGEGWKQNLGIIGGEEPDVLATQEDRNHRLTGSARPNLKANRAGFEGSAAEHGR
jgi:hypothetical protein